MLGGEEGQGLSPFPVALRIAQSRVRVGGKLLYAVASSAKMGSPNNDVTEKRGQVSVGVFPSRRKRAVQRPARRLLALDPSSRSGWGLVQSGHGSSWRTLAGEGLR